MDVPQFGVITKDPIVKDFRLRIDCFERVISLVFAIYYPGIIKSLDTAYPSFLLQQEHPKLIDYYDIDFSRISATHWQIIIDQNAIVTYYRRIKVFQEKLYST